MNITVIVKVRSVFTAQTTFSMAPRAALTLTGGNTVIPVHSPRTEKADGLAFGSATRYNTYGDGTPVPDFFCKVRTRIAK